ncbi:hypothetical protein C488_18585 [Natrinema pellirubrum DSM 15624]|uniref:Uncharacterized protein n=1 Tax=Natrinema pellirubrum (strain DSM 15624 / CIP 106293 / JCM 10476 / NCIMB 786 / 157) TaxID=797303 RepID=L0JSG1_NATP1|nr:DUF6069 family protein [Natrinema pellirubrum]AGB33592.1 hypothetical protein Natpe_3832 [Natrinema pellirubrum DSM 15624]ELY70449.1 hypothetical protein C488_18585 [Natrinema pellirubrum DSM 15624]
MDSEAGVSESARPLSRSDLVRSGAVALVVSLVINWLIVFMANAGGIAPELEALNYEPVSFFTTIGVVGATVTYGILARTVADQDRAFAIVAAIVLGLSVLPDFVVIPDQPGGSLFAGAVLGLMHVTTAVVCVWVLTDRRNGR